MTFTEFVRILKWLEDTRSFEDFKVQISGESWYSNVTEININFEMKTINIVGDQ